MTGTRRWLRIGAAALLLGVGSLAIGAPAASAAQAVSGSTSWGSFSCTDVRVSGGSGDSTGYFRARCSVTDAAKDGHAVYLSYYGVRDGLWDTGWHKGFTNSDGKGWTVSYSVTYSSAGVDSWRIRVCKSVADATDPCSAWDAAS